MFMILICFATLVDPGSSQSGVNLRSFNPNSTKCNAKLNVKKKKKKTSRTEDGDFLGLATWSPRKKIMSW